MSLKDIEAFQNILREVVSLNIKYLILFFVVIAPVGLFAQDLLFDNSAPVALHKKNISSHDFSIPRSKSSSVVSMGDIKVTNPFAKKLAFVVFGPKDSRLSKEIEDSLLYSMPNRCDESKVVLDEVYHDTEGSEKIDLLIYDPSDISQMKNANRMSNVALAPWDPTYDPSAGYDSVDAKIQDLARVMSPVCLPARIKFIYVASKRYKEVRYGEKVWEN